jgi:hypothetical protein
MSNFSKVSLKDAYGFVAECTPMDELRIAQSVRLVGSTFSGTTIDTNFWAVTIAASGGTIATADLTTMPGALNISSKTDSAGSVIVQSVRKARYVGGNANRYRAQVQFSDTGKTNNTKRWGIYDGTDGAYFMLSGTTLSACTIKAGSEVAVTSANWNGSTVTPTLTNVNTYEIYITNAKVYFVIAGVLVHTVSATSSTWTSTTTLPVRAGNVNSGNTTDTIMYIRVMTIYRLGPLETNPTWKNITGVTSSTILKYGAGVLHELIVGTVVNSATISIYDNVTGTSNLISTLSLPEIAVPMSLAFHCPFATGLNIVPSSATLNITVVYE